MAGPARGAALGLGRCGTTWAKFGYARTVPHEPEDAEAADLSLRPDPDSISSVAELGRQLRLLRISVGSPPLRELEARSAASGEPLPRSTAANAESGRHLPRLEVIRAFVQACSGSDADLRRWQAAWQRLYIQRYVPAGTCGLRSSPPAFLPVFNKAIMVNTNPATHGRMSPSGNESSAARNSSGR